MSARSETPPAEAAASRIPEGATMAARRDEKLRLRAHG
jgi:hypothetical protein